MPMTDEIRAALQAVQDAFDGKVRAADDLRGEPLYVADREVVHEFLRSLRDDARLRCEFLVYVTAQDNYLEEPRFDVVYCARSMRNNFDVRVKVPVPGDDAEVDTATDLWPAADWMEREVWDMFGIRFRGHGNLERILMWEGFEGFPLRKDYPLLGNTPGTPGYLGKGGKR